MSDGSRRPGPLMQVERTPSGFRHTQVGTEPIPVGQRTRWNLPHLRHKDSPTLSPYFPDIQGELLGPSLKVCGRMPESLQGYRGQAPVVVPDLYFDAPDQLAVQGSPRLEVSMPSWPLASVACGDADQDWTWESCDRRINVRDSVNYWIEGIAATVAALHP
jgi:hypothetical protein